MDNSNIIHDFEQLLQKQTLKKHLPLYKNVVNTNERTYKPQDVIQTVYSQIKAIQLADTRSIRTGSNNFNAQEKHKKSNFLPVAKLPVYKASIPNPNKFETQCVSDTQLIHIIEGVEAIDTHTGITQEFEITFANVDDKNQAGTDEDERMKKRDIEERSQIFDCSMPNRKETKIDKDLIITTECHNSEKKVNSNVQEGRENFTKRKKFNIDDEITKINPKLSPKLPNEKTVTISSDIPSILVNNAPDKEMTEDIVFPPNITLKNDDSEIKGNLKSSVAMNIDTDQEVHRPTSPVLNTLDRKRKTSSPLVVPLESFEIFEDIAIPVIEKNLDKETAKHLINSQILGRELVLNVNTNTFCVERNYSPILTFNSDELILNSQDLNAQINKTANDVIPLKDLKNVIEKSNEMLCEDEILFSSDEEIEQAHKALQDLPLTCALETSSYEQSGVIDKTMYVGFQTASNKSIQILTNSFDNAKIIFEDKAETDKEFSLTELVEKYDTHSTKHKERRSNAVLNMSENNTVTSCSTGSDSISEKAVNNVEIGQVKENKLQCKDAISNPPITMFNGFITASNKKIINMSDKAIARCQKVFKDIDVGLKFDSLEDEEKSNLCNDKNDTCPNMDIKDERSNVQEIIDDNINDELLLEEFENIKMSLEEKENNRVKINTSCGELGIVNNHISITSQNVINQSILDRIEHRNDIDTYDKSPKTLLLSGNGSKWLDNKISFRTASNKNISISAIALAKTKNVFQDVDLKINPNENTKPCVTELDKVGIDIINLPSTSKVDFIGFKTASNRDIKLSDNALSKSKNLFKDINNDIYMEEFQEPTFKGCKTASNKNIAVFEQGLAKTKKVFENIGTGICKEHAKETNDENDDPVLYDGDNQKSSNITEFIGFKTANNKRIKISDTALSKSKDIFKDLDKVVPKPRKNVKTEISIEEEYGDNKICQKTNKSVCFESTDNKLVESGAISKPEDIVDPITAKLEKYSFGGFKTASNRHVKISEQALLKSKTLFKDIETTDSINNRENKDGLMLVKPPMLIEDLNHNQCKLYINDGKYENPMLKGFQTASRKPVTFSADALAKTKRIFQDIDKVDDKLSTDKPNQFFQGFQTANNKPVEVSAEALISSKKVLQDLHENITQNPANFVGFKTASDKNLAISVEALAKCRKIFENIDIEPNPDLNIPNTKINPPTKSAFKGFQTASQQKVMISKEAIEKTNNIFELISKNKNTIGFQTGNNKRETVSKEALDKSRQLFHHTSKYAYNDKVESTKITENIKLSTHKQYKVNIENKDTIMKENSTKLHKDQESRNTITDCLINTQVLSHFETSLHTEDFKQTPLNNKRSGSPILSCPRAKKRKKFETPYRSANAVENVDIVKKTIKKDDTIIAFIEDYKKNKKYKLKELIFEKHPNKIIDTYILDFNLENILNFKFSGARNDLKEGTMTIDDIKKVFTDATNKKLIPDGWLENHLKLILWKLVSYEIRFPNSLGIVCTVKNVIDQLKYRYDKELYNAERPILRKILEKDDVSTNTIVFCVAGIYVDNTRVTSITNPSNIELLLTDGWYFIRATIDKMLSKLVYDEKIVVGCKIITEGAELVNCEQGIAPWEDTSSVRLTISGNSTRPARWDTQLGLRPVRLRSTLVSVKPEGGRVRCLRTVLTRLYPMIYVEKFQDGSTVTRSERLEHLYQMKYEAEREIMIEKIYEEVEKEFSDPESQDSEGSCNSSKQKVCDSGSQIAKMMKKSRDPMEFRTHLTSSQIQKLQDHTGKQRDKYLQAIQERVREKLQPRHIVTLARARIVGLQRDGDKVTITKGMLSVWKPNEAVLEILKEGTWIEVMNVVPTGIRNSEIQISAGRQSVFRSIKCKEDTHFAPYLQELKRTCFKLKDLSHNPSVTTAYNEIDTVGFIFLIEPSIRDYDSDKHQFQNLYLADSDKNIICVNFWGGLKKFGFENVLDTGQVVFCANLQKRSGNTRRNVPQYRATELSIFTKSPKNEKARDSIDELNKKLFGLDKRKYCEDCIAIKQNYSVLKCFNNYENVSPYRFNNSAYNLAKNKLHIETPKGLNDKGKTEDFDLSGLDFESTFKQPETQQMSPKTLQRKKQVAEKIAKLKIYGEPPPLSPINIINISKNVINSYKSPLISKSDSVAAKNNCSVTSNVIQNVCTPSKVPDDKVNNLVTSPIISMNRTYVKRINPVKLNFSESVAIGENDSIDHFAEEFDGSPPLSLD